MTFVIERAPWSVKRRLGLFLTLNEPTREMEKEAAAARFYETGEIKKIKVPKVQILTAAQILDGRRPRVPFGFTESIKSAAREQSDNLKPPPLLLPPGSGCLASIVLA